MECESQCDTNCNWCAWNDPERLGKRTGSGENWRKCRDYPNYSITKIGQNTKKGPGNLRGLAVSPFRDHQQMLV